MRKDEQGRVRRPAGAARTAANETPGARGASGRGRRSVSGRGDSDALRRGGAGGNSFAPADEMPGAFDGSGTGGAQSGGPGASGRGRRSVSGRGDSDALWRGAAGGNPFAPADEMPGAFGVSGAGGAPSGGPGASGPGASGRGRKGMSGRGDSDTLRRGGAGGNPFAPADEMPGAFDVSGTGGAPSGGFGASGRGRRSVSGRGDSDALRRGGASGAQSDDFGASGDIRFDPAEDASGPSDADEPGLAEASAQADPAEVWALYEKARSFNYAIDLYDNVEKNEDFYIGNQWRGVNAPDLDKPVINILARVVKFFISAIVSDDIGVSVTDFDGDARKKPFLDMLTARFSEAMEHMDFRKKTREVIRNAAVDGDGCVHYYFDPEAGGAQPMGGTPGAIEAEIIENTNVHFGNPQLADVEKQPYILLSFRRLVGDVRREAAWPDEVGPDEDSEKYGDAPEEGKVTVIRKYWKQRGRRGRRTVWFCDVTRSALVRAPTDTGLVRYPVAFFPWEKVKNQFHGQAAITGMIPNQIFINKLMAMAMQHVKAAAFPKVVYNRMLIPAGWSNRVGEAIPVNGDPNAAVASGWRAPDMSAQVLQMLDKMIDCTRDTMGASDAVLGNIKPDNTSAIVATQQATTMPLELQRQDFYSFVEASVRIWLDMMGAYYGVRAVRIALPASGPGGMGLRMAGLYGPAALPAAAGGARRAGGHARRGGGGRGLAFAERRQ